MSGGARLLIATALLVLGAAAAVLSSASRGRDAAARSAEFQQASGGLGLGGGLTLSPCAWGFDPRVDGPCRGQVDPVVGGERFCRRHRSLLPPP